MPERGVALEKLGFLTIGLFDGADPGPGHQYTLEMIELAERLGFDSAWLRCRHLQYGISSPVAVLAAAAQRTARIELGTAVIPLGWENPLRLAEDPRRWTCCRARAGSTLGSAWASRCTGRTCARRSTPTRPTPDFSYERGSRLLRFVADRAATFDGNEDSSSSRRPGWPHSPGLRARMWYGGASLASARWASSTRSTSSTSSVVRAEESEDSGDGPAEPTSGRSARRTRPGRRRGCRRVWW